MSDFCKLKTLYPVQYSKKLNFDIHCGQSSPVCVSGEFMLGSLADLGSRYFRIVHLAKYTISVGNINFKMLLAFSSRNKQILMKLQAV